MGQKNACVSRCLSFLVAESFNKKNVYQTSSSSLFVDLSGHFFCLLWLIKVIWVSGRLDFSGLLGLSVLFFKFLDIFF